MASAASDTQPAANPPAGRPDTRVLPMRPDMIVHAADPLNAETPRAALAQSDLTPLDLFYVRSHGPIPVPRGGEPWRIEVVGLVTRELELSVADLARDFDGHELIATLQCAGNRRAGLIAVRDIPGAALRRLGPAGQGARARGPARLGDERRAPSPGPRRAAAGGRPRLHRRAQ